VWLLVDWMRSREQAAGSFSARWGRLQRSRCDAGSVASGSGMDDRGLGATPGAACEHRCRWPGSVRSRRSLARWPVGPGHLTSVLAHLDAARTDARMCPMSRTLARMTSTASPPQKKSRHRPRNRLPCPLCRLPRPRRLSPPRHNHPAHGHQHPAPTPPPAPWPSSALLRWPPRACGATSLTTPVSEPLAQRAKHCR
jgi:hypothetical protein